MKYFKQARKMVLSLSAAIFLYAFLSHYLINIQNDTHDFLNPSNYKIIFFVVIVFCVGAFAFAISRSRRLIMINEKTLELSLNQKVQKLYLYTVFLCAAAQLSVLSGLGMVFLGKNPFDYYPFAAIASVLFFFAYPRKSIWIKIVGEIF